MVHHQAERADISDQHTEIREALMDDVMAVSKKLAHAIRDGEISTLALVRMVGEGHIIKKKGRAIASVGEVADLIRNASGHQSTYVQVDPAEYYKDAAFSRDHLKTALKSLQGEELRIFSSMFPNEVLEEAGMPAKDVKAMREATAKQYDQMIADAITGLHAKSDEALKEMGLAQNEIAQVRDAYAKLEDTGLDAVKSLKTNAANDHGVEHLLTNAVVHNPKYLGALLKDGHDKFANPAANDDALMASASHAERLSNREAQSDAQYSGAANSR